MFRKMIGIARNKLDIINECVCGLSLPQVTVLLTDNDNFYVAVNDLDGAICEELKRDGNTKIVKLLTMWKDGGIDLSSISFRKVLVEMDEYNQNTEIILQGKDGYIIKKLSATIL